MDKNFIAFTIDGELAESGKELQVFKLCYDFNELADAETLTGLNLNVAYLGGTVTVSQFRATLYAFLKAHHPKVTLKEAGGLMDTADGRQKCFDAVGKLLLAEVKEEIAETADA